jgi:hypothetical protein
VEESPTSTSENRGAQANLNGGARTDPHGGARDALLATKWQWCELLASHHGPPAYSTRLVLLVLSLHMPGDDIVVVRGVTTKTKRPAVAWPSQQTIADRSGLRLRTVKLAVAVARRAGWLSVAGVVQLNNGRGWRGNEYTATVPAHLAEHIPAFDLSFNRSANLNGGAWRNGGGAYGAPAARSPADEVVHMTVSRGADNGNDVVHHMPPNLTQRIYKSSERAPEIRGARDAPARAQKPDDLKNRGAREPEPSKATHASLGKIASAALARPVGGIESKRKPITDAELAGKVHKLRGAGLDDATIAKQLAAQAAEPQLTRVLKSRP